jgi:hypothetical protein
MPIVIATIGSGALIVVALINGYVAKKVSEASNKITEVGHRVDGRMDELLELTRKASHAEGVQDQKQISSNEAIRLGGVQSAINDGVRSND